MKQLLNLMNGNLPFYIMSTHFCRDEEVRTIETRLVMMQLKHKKNGPIMQLILATALKTPWLPLLIAGVAIELIMAIIDNSYLKVSPSLFVREKTALACKSTNYKCFKGPKLQWQSMGSGVRRASLLTRDNSTFALPKLASDTGQRLLAIGG